MLPPAASKWADLAEDHLRRRLFISLGAPGGDTGDVGDAAHHQAVRPGSGGLFRDLGAVDA